MSLASSLHRITQAAQTSEMGRNSRFGGLLSAGKNTYFPLLKILKSVYNDKHETNAAPIVRVLAGSRVLFFPQALSKYVSMDIVSKLSHPTQALDPLYFLVHKYHLSRRFTLYQRVQTAMEHNEYELNRFTAEYAKKVYRSDGILLWEYFHRDTRFKIVLAATDDNRHEGELSVYLYANDARLCRMSFCYLSGDNFGLGSHMTMLISRNQTDRNEYRGIFNQCFKQNKVQLFCLYALCGIAMTNGFKYILGIKHNSQIAYDEVYKSGFRNSYTALWETFEAAEIDGHAFMLDLPLKLRPVQSVNRVHRNRARERRSYWNDIMQSACLNVGAYLKNSKLERPCSPESKPLHLQASPPV